MAESIVRIEPGQAIAPHLVPGAIVSLAPGVHRENLLIEASVTLRGEPGAVLDAARGGPVIHVDLDELSVTIQDLTLTGGVGEAGGAVRVSGWSEVSLERCALVGNEATQDGGGIGGGVYAHRGMLRLLDCTFRDNRARSATDFALAGAARAELRGGHFAGDVYVLEGAELTAVGTVIAGKLRARGTTTRAPVLTLRGVRIDGGLDNDVNLPATVVVEDS